MKMLKTEFLIKDMDCPSEEQMIRMKLADYQTIKSLDFDLDARKLTVFHETELEKISNSLDSLNLGSNLIQSSEYNDEITSSKIDRKLLWWVLIINFGFFVLEAIFGYVSNSMGLVADSLDMLADAFVYGLCIYAISGRLLIKKRISRLSGTLQMSLAILGLIEVLRRFIGLEEIPNFTMMIGISVLALIGNSLSLVILNKSKSDEVHIKSSQIFTSNDVIANVGVILAGISVYFLDSRLPDLIIGLIVFTLVFRGALRIFELSKN